MNLDISNRKRALNERVGSLNNEEFFRLSNEIRADDGDLSDLDDGPVEVPQYLEKPAVQGPVDENEEVSSPRGPEPLHLVGLPSRLSLEARREFAATLERAQLAAAAKRGYILRVADIQDPVGELVRSGELVRQMAARCDKYVANRSGDLDDRYATSGYLLASFAKALDGYDGLSAGRAADKFEKDHGEIWDIFTQHDSDGTATDVRDTFCTQWRVVEPCRFDWGRLTAASLLAERHPVSSPELGKRDGPYVRTLSRTYWLERCEVLNPHPGAAWFLSTRDTAKFAGLATAQAGQNHLLRAQREGFLVLVARGIPGPTSGIASSYRFILDRVVPFASAELEE